MSGRSPRELDLAARLGGRAVDRADDGRVGEGEPVDADQVVDVDPAEPLPAGAEPAAEEQPEGKRQQPQDRRIRARGRMPSGTSATRTPSASARARRPPTATQTSARKSWRRLGRLVGGVGVAAGVDIASPRRSRARLGRRSAGRAAVATDEGIGGGQHGCSRIARLRPGVHGRGADRHARQVDDAVGAVAGRSLKSSPGRPGVPADRRGPLGGNAAGRPCRGRG